MMFFDVLESSNDRHQNGEILTIRRAYRFTGAIYSLVREAEAAHPDGINADTDAARAAQREIDSALRRYVSRHFKTFRDLIIIRAKSEKPDRLKTFHFIFGYNKLSAPMPSALVYVDVVYGRHMPSAHCEPRRH